MAVRSFCDQVRSFRQIIAEQRVLVLRVGRTAAAAADVLHRLQERPTPVTLASLRPQARDDLSRRKLRRFERLERDGDIGARAAAAARAEAAAARPSRSRSLTAGSAWMMLATSCSLRLHQLKRTRRVAANAALQLAGVLLRKEALGNHDVQIDIQADGREQQEHHDAPMIQRPVERGFVVAAQAARSRARSLRRSGRLARLRSLRSSSEHIIGVVVSEITREIRIDTDSVTVNSRKMRPTMPPANMKGMNTATSDRLMETTVKPTSCAPRNAAAGARHAGLDVPGGVFHDDDGVVHHEAGRDGERHQREIVEGVAEQVHRAEGADQRDRHDQRGNQRGAIAVQEHVDHQNDHGHREHQGLLDLAQRGADGDRAVEGHHQIDLRIDSTA